MSNGSCLFGDCPFLWKNSSKHQETILKHLLEVHRVVIANVQTVYDLGGYCKYWRNKINTGNVAEFLHGFSVQAPEGEESKGGLFYMLNDTTSEDCSLRHRLFSETQQRVLNQQQMERACEDFKVKCLFCPETLTGSRFTLSEHLYNQHSFTLGHPDNLVYTEEFIERLRSKMLRAECLFCDKTFRDYKILREHMRKKLHKKVNPANTEFDKYYVINYREFGKTWKVLSADTSDTDIDSRSNHTDSAAEEDWEDWKESVPEIKCLICSVSYTRLSDIKKHLLLIHRIDFDKLTANLSFYSQIKLVNYLRYRVEERRCPFCDLRTASTPEKGEEEDDSLTEHLATNHSPADRVRAELYSEEQFLFPALENDYLLCCLRDEGEGEGEERTVVIPEDPR